MHIKGIIKSITKCRKPIYKEGIGLLWDLNEPGLTTHLVYNGITYCGKAVGGENKGWFYLNHNINCKTCLKVAYSCFAVKNVGYYVQKNHLDRSEAI